MLLGLDMIKNSDQHIILVSRINADRFSEKGMYIFCAIADNNYTTHISRTSDCIYPDNMVRFAEKYVANCYIILLNFLSKLEVISKNGLSVIINDKTKTLNLVMSDNTFTELFVYQIEPLEGI